MLKVLGRRTSINVRKVLWTVGELGLSYEREDWGTPGRDPNVPEFLALNPNAQVPVIIDDGFVMSESNAVIRYLCERGGDTTLLPPDLRQRALVAQWLSWQATELNAQWGYAVYALLRKEKGFDDEERIAQSLSKWGAKMRILEDQLGKPAPSLPATSASPTSHSGYRYGGGWPSRASSRHCRTCNGTTTRSAPARRVPSG